jgi:hypothetical protein
MLAVRIRAASVEFSKDLVKGFGCRLDLPSLVPELVRVGEYVSASAQFRNGETLRENVIDLLEHRRFKIPWVGPR